MQASVKVEVLKMTKSEGADYYVSITVDGRNVTPHMFQERYKAEYEVANWRHIFFGEPKPFILDFNETTHPNN